MSDFGSLVASTEHGAVLEKFLDEKLDRKKHIRSTVPSYITADDDFADPDHVPPAPPQAEEQAEGEQPQVDEVESHSGPPKFGGGLLPSRTKYADFKAEEKALDAMIYNVLVMNVKSTKNEMLHHVAFPSYVAKNSKKRRIARPTFFEKNQLFNLKTPIDRKHVLPVDCREHSELKSEQFFFY